MQNLSKLCRSSECSHKGQYISLDNFHKNKSRKDGLHHICKDCRRRHSSSEEERRRSREYDKAISQKRADRRFKKVYGISMEDYEYMLYVQGYKCAICTTHVSEVAARRGVSRLFVDHCHVTGKVRGLLCTNCNSGLGMFKDDKLRLIRAIEYLNGKN